MRMAMDSIEGARTSAAVLATCLVVETPRPLFGARDLEDSDKLSSCFDFLPEDDGSSSNQELVLLVIGDRLILPLRRSCLLPLTSFNASSLLSMNGDFCLIVVP